MKTVREFFGHWPSVVDEYLVEGASYARLRKEYDKHDSLVIAFDLDNTVKDFHNKGNTYPLVIDLLDRLQEIGCYLICFTASEDVKEVAKYLSSNGIPYDAINKNPPFFQSTSPKIYYNALLDDRAGLIQVYKDLDKLYKDIVSKNN